MGGVRAMRGQLLESKGESSCWCGMGQGDNGTDASQW